MRAYRNYQTGHNVLLEIKRKTIERYCADKGNVQFKKMGAQSFIILLMWPAVPAQVFQSNGQSCEFWMAMVKLAKRQSFSLYVQHLSYVLWFWKILGIICKKCISYKHIRFIFNQLIESILISLTGSIYINTSKRYNKRIDIQTMFAGIN